MHDGEAVVKLARMHTAPYPVTDRWAPSRGGGQRLGLVRTGFRGESSGDRDEERGGGVNGVRNGILGVSKLFMCWGTKHHGVLQRGFLRNMPP